jgi:hypothetical protein
MLFDLRSPHRRRVIKVVYVFLAVLIGSGLIIAGVGTGSGFGGGLISAIFSGGSTSTTGQTAYTKALAKAEKNAKASPHDAALWVKAGEASYSLATLPTNYSATVGFTKSGHAALNQMRQAWTNYLADAPANPNSFFAGEVVAAFAAPPSGVGDFKTAASAQEVVAAGSPSDIEFEYLAYYSWLAGDTAGGNLAAAKARALAPKKDLKTVNTTLTEMLTAANAYTGATSATGATGATGASSATGATGG